jgi:hypothetical protein
LSWLAGVVEVVLEITLTMELAAALEVYLLLLDTL